MSHLEPETACQAQDAQLTHILRTPASSRSAQDGVAPRPAPPPALLHPQHTPSLPPSHSEPHRAGGPPRTSRVLPRSDLMAMSPELPQDRHMLSIHSGALETDPPQPYTPGPTHPHLPGEEGATQVSLLLALGSSLQACHPTHRCHSPTRVPSLSWLESINPLLGPRQHLPPCPLALLPQPAQASPSGLCPSFPSPLLVSPGPRAAGRGRAWLPSPGLLRRHRSSYSTSACRRSRFCCLKLEGGKKVTVSSALAACPALS